MYVDLFFTVNAFVLQNPFIANAGSTMLIAKLVEECMPAIDEYREMEAREAEANVRRVCIACGL